MKEPWASSGGSSGVSQALKAELGLPQAVHSLGFGVPLDAAALSEPQTRPAVAQGLSPGPPGLPEGWNGGSTGVQR